MTNVQKLGFLKKALLVLGAAGILVSFSTSTAQAASCYGSYSNGSGEIVACQ